MALSSLHNRAFTKKIKRRDKLARWIITSGGFLIIATVAGIMLLIANVSLPLFFTPESETLLSKDSPKSFESESVAALGIDEYKQWAFLVKKSGSVGYFNLDKSKTALAPTNEVELTGNRQIVFAEEFGKHHYTFLFADGTASLVKFGFNYGYDSEQNRSTKITHEIVHQSSPSSALSATAAYIRIADAKRVGVFWSSPKNMLQIETVSFQEKQEGIFGLIEGDDEPEEELLRTYSFLPKKHGLDETITAVAPSSSGSTIYVGFESGTLAIITPNELGDAARVEVIKKAVATKVTALGVLFGDTSLIVGEETGLISGWFKTNQNGQKRLTKIRDIISHRAAVQELKFSSRDKTIISRDSSGIIKLSYFTSARQLFELGKDRQLNQFSYAPRGDAMLAITEPGQILLMKLDAPHPEISYGTLFQKVWYENYDQPEYVWQSTGGTDEFESKISIVPLIYGTLKATFYAMLFALPLAILGAIYLNQFASRRFRNIMKSSVELMAALPSVVIGFLAALWLAPLFIDNLGAIFVTLISAPVAFILFLLSWHALRSRAWAKKFENGYEFVIILPVVAVSILTASLVAGPFEAFFFGGDLTQWVYDSFLTRIDQRNSIVISVALGFAVIPLILSISEDSLSSVPPALSAGSLALGASRWQTVWRIIVPSASPGIFAASMIGFGRAVGETMIVLMATGNTPIMDMSIFNGMRTLAANVAVEIPEAPLDGTLYRTLFLCATILFCMTFSLNTVAEVVRQRLRKKYARF